VWAFAKVCVRAEALFNAVAEAAVGSRLRDFDPQALATTVWAFAAADLRHAELLVECMHVISQSLRISCAD
jgi:hypothetical protein